jgi:hypothetical protein
VNAKHTPGPWEVDHAGYGSRAGFVVDEYFVRHRDVADNVAIASDIVDPATQKPSEANARLIAAAPELLQALQALDRSGHTEAAWDLAKRAMAKATGGAA